MPSQTPVCGFTAPQGGDVLPHWISYLSVEDVGATAKAMVRGGGRTAEPESAVAFYEKTAGDTRRAPAWGVIKPTAA